MSYQADTEEEARAFREEAARRAGDAWDKASPEERAVVRQDLLALGLSPEEIGEDT